MDELQLVTFVIMKCYEMAQCSLAAWTPLAPSPSPQRCDGANIEGEEQGVPLQTPLVTGGPVAGDVS